MNGACNFGGDGGFLTCDIGSHESFSSHHLHLHDAHVLQVGEGLHRALRGRSHTEVSRSTNPLVLPPSFSWAHVALEDLRAFLRVVQRCDGQVSDGHVSRGRQRHQQHHVAPGLLQLQLQVMGFLFGQSGQVQLTAEVQRSRIHSTSTDQTAAAIRRRWTDRPMKSSLRPVSLSHTVTSNTPPVSSYRCRSNCSRH